MHLITRYRVDKDNKSLGPDGFVDQDDAFEYRSIDEANDDAELHDAEVTKIQRLSRTPL